MRAELKPDIETAEKLFPEIVNILENYVNDGNGNIAEVENKLKKLTGKNIKEYFLSSWLEEDEIEDIALALCVPDNNKKYKNITKDELVKLVEIFMYLKLESNKTIDEMEMERRQSKTFEEKIKHKLFGYYHNILKNNFKRYNYEMFNKQKGENGNDREYTVEEIVKEIMGIK
jgi:hypothetical protein